MQVGFIEILSGTAIFALTFYYYLTSSYSYWKSREIPGPKPELIFGNLKNVIFGKISLGNFVREEYEKYKDQAMFGIFASGTPILVINDPELIKEVLIKQFTSFANRGIRIFEKIEPLSANLVNLEVDRWKPLRAKQTFMFTSGKLKDMFYLLMKCTESLEKILNGMLEKGEVVECCEVTSRFSTDVIGSCVFGIDMKALEDENSQFRKIGRKFIYADKWRAFKIRLKSICPQLFKLLGFLMYDREINDFFINSIKDTMEYRKQNSIRRNDFLDLLIDLKDHPEKVDSIELTDTLLTAQAFAFFFAGFETSSTTMSHALYELALNHSIQDKLRDEISAELMKKDGKLEYEDIENMRYLHKVFSETLRKYPIATLVVRQATRPFTFSYSGKELSIPKDMRVWVPVYGIHHDPNIYPYPETFDPQRFSKERIKDIHPSHYLPFGAGPRNCIGARFGTLQTKIGLITIVKNYKLDVCDQTTIPYVSNPRRFLLGPAAGIHLKLTKL